MITKNFSWQQYTTMWGYILDFKHKNGRLPNFIDYDGLHILKASYQDAYNRVVAYRNSHHGQNPATVNVSGTPLTPAPSPTPTPVPQPPTDPVIEQIKDAVGGFNNFREYYEQLRHNKYSHYLNDVYNQAGEIQRLKNHSGLNCVDFSQISARVGRYYGHDVHYIHVYCLISKVGHIRLQVDGVNIDPAAAACSNYSYGNVWCANGTFIGKDEAWLVKGT